jgi:hypothetical protein
VKCGVNGFKNCQGNKTSVVKMSKVAKEITEVYAPSLSDPSDLTLKSKPLINMLTMLVDENIMHTPIIV